MAPSNALISRGSIERPTDTDNSKGSRTEYSEGSYLEGDPLGADYSHMAFENPSDSRDVQTAVDTDIASLSGVGVLSSNMHAQGRLGNARRLKGEYKQEVLGDDIGSCVNMKYLRNDSMGSEPPLKLAVDYNFEDRQFRVIKQKSRHSAHLRPLNDIDGGQCVSTFYTVIAMGLMLIALFIPALFHVCCQFRLYGSMVHITENITDVYDAQKDRWTIIDRLSEFENFFFFGVFLYLAIQTAGFYATRARIRRYLWRLCCIAVETAKHEFLYCSKQRAMEYFSDYAKRIYRDQTNAYVQTEQNLMKAFDDASLKFNNYQVEDVWCQIAFVRYRMMCGRIYLPMLINMIVSIGTSAFVYDRRFRMHHRVPLAHPDLLANLYWYAAIQYEGVWCICTMFILNFMTWLYLCHTNRHKTLFGLLEDTRDQIQTIATGYGTKLAKDIWDNQMLLFSSTIYALDSKIHRGSTYTPGKLEALNSQINFNSMEIRKDKRPCLCHCLCLPTIEERNNEPISFMGTSPLEELHVPLLDPEIQGGMRQDSRTML
ncbi:hypothetical protein X943_001285 [Babesia divergens]|uniref:Uncharacterized protein n=1 Tax=Babesia divergens TaxID=32595 RepID=A0AAD9GJB7_BABDI|nr:hypothetical protein X943_001285 [Babesia divergens]